eukprot:CAMPEP_0196761334 /NCGR_PEP_ID=MMETSP1095-20130614/534_1 /TAXON_ID=96789 ORGANISM="Chromulina nebulosa, Strain UTEXLB2642" /NCGR_SAMPLE_ID=MMETSP1095 /ASSEMBLY_ACC=CAM_ASM_000446 /LENGTH=391 /DNA_ID=CAMNT_0042110737 /DNA_START=225 /DNA_END=1400 /DNA_ORIENTATION=+
MYSGYINVTTSPDYLFYWFFETQDGNEDAPLIIWTNGGPGCTAMEGATTEIGPLSLFDIKESCSSSTCDYTGQFSKNPYAWNAHANLLFLDQPRNVGYSFGYGSSVSSSVQAADDFVVFYNEWLTEFPEFVDRPLVIAGESYGGHYIPAWANAILDYNENYPDNTIPFSGALIGNGCVNNTVQNSNEYISFLHEQNLIPSTSNPSSQALAEVAMVKNLGYSPNYYDYRIQSISCNACYGYNYTAWSYWFLQSTVETALNVCGEAGNDAFSGSAGGCISLGSFDSKDSFDYSGALARTLEAGIPVTLYYGKADTACNYVGGYAMASTISWNGQEQFSSQSFEELEISGVEAGQVKSYGGLTFIQVESAGHMVPLDQPAASAYAVNTILSTIA